MAVIGLGQQFSAGVLNSNEGPGARTGALTHPAKSFVRRIIYALVCDGDYLPVVRNKVAEGAAAATGVAGHPGDAAVG